MKKLITIVPAYNEEGKIEAAVLALKAKKEFFDEKASFSNALETTKSRHPEHEDSFYNQIKKTTKILQSCPVKRIEEIKTDGNKKYILKDLYKEVNSFCKKLGIGK